MAHQNSDGRMAVPSVVDAAVHKIGHSYKLDAAAERLAPLAGPVSGGRVGEVLRGQWLGHALHPLLTDFPLGCWLSASVLDVVGGRGSRRSARRLVGAGLVFSLPAAASGLADWSHEQRDHDRVRRFGVVHGVGNVAVMVVYGKSYRARRRGDHGRGMGWSFLGGAMAVVTGWLGGHLSLVERASSGPRGLEEEHAGRRGADHVGGPQEVVDLDEASRRLGVPVEQVRVMVADGLLVPVEATGAPRFRSADVEAVRLLGG